LTDQLKEKKEEIDGKWTVWKQEQAVLKEKEREEYLAKRAEQEIQHKKYKEEQEQRKKEEEAKLPFTDEIALADFLLTYLSNIRYQKNKPNSQIKHSIDYYIHFEDFSVSPPAVAKDIERCKTQIQQKKDDFLEKQRAELVRREELKQQAPPQEAHIEHSHQESNEEKKEVIADVPVDHETVQETPN